MARPSVLGSSKSGAACPHRSGIMAGIVVDAGPRVKIARARRLQITISR
jgi:hypothetical protein